MTDLMSKPSDTIVVDVGGHPHKIHMSWGRLRRLTKMMSEAQGISPMDSAASFMIKPDDMARVVHLCLAGKDEDPAPAVVPDYEISLEDVSRLTDWATEHGLYFFVSGLGRVQALARKTAPAVSSLTSSLPGLEDSISTTPPPGLSESP